MTNLLVLARVILATIFLVAGLAKLADRPGSRRSLSDFGIPPWLAGPGSLLLPWAELAVAFSLIPSSSAAYGALGAALLLVLFVAGIGLNLSKGRRPDCHCFGQLHSTPIGSGTIVRNVGLALLAIVILVAGGMGPAPSVLFWAGRLSPLQHAAFYGGLAVVALLGFISLLLLRIVRQNGELLERVTKPVPVTAASGDLQSAADVAANVAPNFLLPALDGPAVSLDALRGAGLPILIFFSDPNCTACQTLLPEIAEFEQKFSHAVTVVLVTRGSADANREKIQGRVSRVLLQRDREVMALYGAAGTPSAILINADGTLNGAIAQGDAEIRQRLAPFVQSLLPPAHQPHAPEGAAVAPVASVAAVAAVVGDEAPEVDLTDLAGEGLSLERFSNQARVILFWNPGCGYCRRMLPDLKAWEGEEGADRPQLIIVSSGSVDDNRALALQSPVGLDPAGFSIAQRYGVTGTPSAVLISPEGRIASQVAVGAPAILTLLKGGAPAATPPAPVVELAAYARPKKERCVQDELLSDGSMILYNGCRHQVMTLNPTAALVWEYCDGELDIAGITAEVRDVFGNGSQPSDVDADVRTVLQNLVAAGMVAPGMVDAGSAS
jgi:peroxiredoxin